MLAIIGSDLVRTAPWVKFAFCLAGRQLSVWCCWSIENGFNEVIVIVCRGTVVMMRV